MELTAWLSPIDPIADSHQATTLTDRRHAAALLSTGDWQAIQEALYLLP